VRTLCQNGIEPQSLSNGIQMGLGRKLTKNSSHWLEWKLWQKYMESCIS
jgi:hypothetical protein